MLDLGVRSDVTRATWRLTVDGRVKRPLTLDFDDLLALERIAEGSGAARSLEHRACDRYS